MTKKRSSWVLFAVMVLVGAFLMVFLGSQNQLPVVQDVIAQGIMEYQGMEYGFSGNIYTYNFYPGTVQYSRPPDMFETAIYCGGSTETSSTCGWNCGPTFSYCGDSGPFPGPFIRSQEQPGYTYRVCPTLTTCGFICGSVKTMLFCPTSTTCGFICGGVKTMLFCTTSTICGGQTGLNCTGFVCGTETTRLIPCYSIQTYQGISDFTQTTAW